MYRKITATKKRFTKSIQNNVKALSVGLFKCFDHTAYSVLLFVYLSKICTLIVPQMG